MKKLRKLLAMTIMLFVLVGAAARGQSALDGFDPNANGLLRVVVVQPDGKILIGGEFTTLSPNGGVAVTRNRIARLNPDGTLDTAFNPNANGVVRSTGVQADGKILAGGDFNGANSIGGEVRNRIARLDATNGLADSDPEKQPSPDRNNFPDSTTDLDDSDGGLDDFNADTSTRNYQDTPLFSVTGLDAVTLRAAGIIPVLLLPIHCSYYLRDHIRERAPPRPGTEL